MPSNFRPRELLRKLGRRLRLSGSGTNNSDTAPIALQAPVQAAAALPAAAPLVEAPLVAAPRVAAFPVADPPRSRLEHQIQTLFAQGLDASPELSPNSSTSSFSEAPLPPIPTEAPLPPLPTQTPADNVQITINVYYVQELGAPDPNHWQPRAADMTVERVPRGGNDPPTNNVPTQTNNASSYADAETQTNLLTLRVNPFNLVDLSSSSSSDDERLDDYSSSEDEVLPFSVSYAGEDVGEYSFW